MKKRNIAVLEMGMSGFGEISFLSKLAKPDYVVITNIGEAHMQDLGSREGIAKAKFEIIDGLAANGKLFYDGDEPLLKSLIEKQTDMFETFHLVMVKEMIYLYGTIESTDEGSRIYNCRITRCQFTIPVYGAHQVKNTLAAILIANEVWC